MLKHMQNPKNIRVILCLMMILSVSVLVQAAEDGYALLLQSSPADGGVVSPGLGIHDNIAMDQVVALSATPKKGYRFLYWLGDVASTTGPDTTVSVNSPKLVIAVFVREDFEGELPGVGITDGQHAPGGGGFRNPIQSPGSVSPTSGVGRGFDFPVRQPNFVLPDFPNDNPDDPDGNDDIPVPGENDDIPVPGDNEVPEPATLFLLGVGSAIFLKRKRR